MRYLKALLVGAVQGATEFLPVSSSGHLILLSKLGLMPTSLFYNLALHLATLLATLIVMRKEVFAALRHPIKGVGKYVCLASLPTLLVAYLFKALRPSLLLGELLGFGFLLTAALLLFSEAIRRDSKGRMLDAKISLLTGFAQGIAALPGVSRSGSTIAVLHAAGVSPEEAASFSFLLSIPVIAGGFLLEGLESGFTAAGANAGEILLAAAAAFFLGLLAAKFMLKQVKKGLKPFIPYLILLGIACYFLP